MGGVDKQKFVADLRRYSKLELDSSILIYHLEDIRPYSELTQIVFAALGRGNVSGILSTLVVTELVTKPYAEGRTDRVLAVENFIHSLPHVMLVAPNYEIARDAARLRGKYNLRTPDALLLSTVMNAGAGGFLTNDARLRKTAAEGLTLLILDDYLK